MSGESAWEVEPGIVDAMFAKADQLLAAEPDASVEEIVLSCVGAAVAWQSSKHVKLCELLMELCLELEGAQR